MKTLSRVVAILVLSAGMAAAQDMTGFSTMSSKHAAALNPQSTKLSPNPHPDLSPKVGGVFADGAKYGWVLVSPGADSTYGIGEKYLAAPRQYGPDVAHLASPGSHRDARGLKLLTFEF